MIAERYREQLERILGDIDSDRSISDERYVDLMDEIANAASSRADAKREELRRAQREEL